MDYSWDPVNAAENLQRHGVEFADAVAALEDDLALTTLDPESNRDNQYVTLGSDAYGRQLVVQYTSVHDRVRLIEARMATAVERRRYLIEA